MTDLRHHRRAEATGPGWRERFVDGDRASASKSVGRAVSESLSYVEIQDFATAEERGGLLDSAAGVTSRNSAGGKSSHVMFASGANGNCDRYSVETLLDDRAKATSAALLDRLLGFLDGGEGEGGGGGPQMVGGGPEMCALAKEVFVGTGTEDRRNLREREVVWYGEPDEAGMIHPEPKVNVYSEGGYFNQRADGMELTLLVVLTDRFEGGGTAFYKDLDLAHGDLPPEAAAAGMSNGDHNLPPEVVAKPQAGTAMIWGATLQHMALPVTKGTRSVYVGSFNLK